VVLFKAKFLSWNFKKLSGCNWFCG